MKSIIPFIPMDDIRLYSFHKCLEKVREFYEYWLTLEKPSDEEIKKYEAAKTYEDDFDEDVGIWVECKYIADKCEKVFAKPVKTLWDLLDKYEELGDIADSISFAEMFCYLS